MNNTKLARNVPRGYALRVHHVHDNGFLEALSHGRPPKYYTQALIYRDMRDSAGRLVTDDTTNPPVVIEEARCSHRDAPSRKVGYHLAVTRALKALSQARRFERVS